MSERLVLPTSRENFTLQQFTTSQDDVKLFEMIEANREFWKDISILYPNLDTVTDDRLAAEDEQELRLGLVDAANTIGWASLITYDQGDKLGNWLGFWVDKNHTRKGYGTLAAQAAIKYVRDNPKLNKVITTTALPDNIPAITVLERVGFEQQAGQEIPYYEGEMVFKLDIGGTEEA